VPLAFFAMPAAAPAACWDLHRVDGSTVRVDDVWQAHNRLTGRSTLLGRVNGEIRSIDLENVRSFGLDDAGQDDTRVRVTMANAEEVVLTTDLLLHYRSATERGQLRLAELTDASQCAESPSAAALAPEPDDTTGSGADERVVARTKDSFLIELNNGDKLYGEIAEEALTWESAYGPFAVRPDQLVSLAASCGDSPDGLLITAVGDQLRGSLRASVLTLDLDVGQQLRIPAAQIHRIRRASTAEEPDSADPCRDGS